MTRTTRKIESERRNKRRKNVASVASVAIGAAAIAFALNGTTARAQFPGYYSGTVRPQLENQRQANEAARAAGNVANEASRAAGNVAGEPETLTLEAVIVAVERYESGEFLPLNGCANDARALKGWLDLNFDDEYRRTDEYRRKAAVLSESGADSVAAPTRENILNVLRQKAERPCDRLFVSFAGHGVSVGGKSYLCPSDALNPRTPDALKRDAARGDVAENQNVLREAADANALNLIAVSEILEILKGAKAKEVILLLDACRDGDAATSFMREFADLLKNADENFKKVDGGAFYVLTSCSLGEKALEVVKNREDRGAFAYYFVEGLAGPADYVGCCDGAVTLVEAYNYAYSKTAAEARRIGGEDGATQTPELFMANVGLTRAPTLARVKLDDWAETDVDALRDQAYLLRVGRVLADVKWARGVNEVGLRTLDCVLEGAPNNGLALRLRGGLRRKLGDYVGSLEDWSQVEQKFQLYVKSRRAEDPALPPRGDAERLTLRLAANVGGRGSGESVASTDLLTVAEIKADARGARWGFVVEKNNVALGENAGWIPLTATVWDWRLASRAITATSLQPTPRVLDVGASSGVAPGRNYTPGGGGGSTPGPLYH